MSRRDRGAVGSRAARRSRAPAFLQSDEEDEEPGRGLLDGISTRRRRRQYDEKMDEDDAEGDEEEEVPLEQLGDVKGGSIGEWLNVESVKRSIAKHFKSFLTTYVDDKGASVYGQKIKNLGESECGLSH